MKNPVSLISWQILSGDNYPYIWKDFSSSAQENFIIDDKKNIFETNHWFLFPGQKLRFWEMRQFSFLYTHHFSFGIIWSVYNKQTSSSVIIPMHLRIKRLNIGNKMKSEWWIELFQSWTLLISREPFARWLIFRFHALQRGTNNGSKIVVSSDLKSISIVFCG